MLSRELRCILCGKPATHRMGRNSLCEEHFASTREFICPRCGSVTTSFNVDEHTAPPSCQACHLREIAARMSEEDRRVIGEYVRGGRKIQAIKAARERVGISLHDAMHLTQGYFTVTEAEPPAV